MFIIACSSCWRSLSLWLLSPKTEGQMLASWMDAWENSKPRWREATLHVLFSKCTHYIWPSSIRPTIPVKAMLNQTRHETLIMPPVVLVIMTLASPDEPLSQLQQKKNRESNKDGGFCSSYVMKRLEKWEASRCRGQQPDFPTPQQSKEGVNCYGKRTHA